MVKDYDDIPVEYCTSCLSLKMLSTEFTDMGGHNKEVPYCGSCGSGATSTTNIEYWKKIYKERYGKDYVSERTEKDLEDLSGL